MDFYAKEDFTRPVFYVENGEIIETTLFDLANDYRDETTTPTGVRPRYFVNGNELHSWVSTGNKASLVHSFDTAEEAEHALLLTFKHDLDSNDNAPFYYSTRADAQEELDAMADD